MASYADKLTQFTEVRWTLAEDIDPTEPEYRWHFQAGDYRNDGPSDKKFIPEGYGRLQFDYDVFAETKEECARKAYVTLTNWFNY